MTRRLIVSPRARIELSEATIRYRNIGVDLGAQFVAAYASTVDRIVGNPFLFQIVGTDIRRAPIGRFPYGLLYTVSDEDIVILSCFHGRRNPRHWPSPPEE